MQVEFSQHFIRLFDTQDERTQDIIMDFVAYVEAFELYGLMGRNKSSATLAPTTKKNREKIAYAQKHCLWHYHIGIPHYVGDDGDKTSEYILHYKRFDEKIVIVDMSAHPPFELPSEEMLS